jgi:uncharacterized protein involved in exopolysaccharide biosynthesis
MAANPYELTTREILSILFKERGKLIGIFLFLFLAVVLWSYLALTPYYQANARLLVKSGREFQVRSDPNQPVAAAPSMTKQEVVNSEIQILTSHDLLQTVITKIGPDRLYPGSSGWFSWLHNGGPDQSAVEAALRHFQDDLKVTPVELADVIDVSYRNPDRALTVETLNTLIDLYQKKHAEMFSDPRYKFLEQQTNEYEHQLDQVTQKVTNLKNSQGLFDADAQRSKLIDERASINTILQQLRSQAVDLHHRIDFLGGKLKGTPQLVPGAATPSDAVDQALARMLDLQLKAQQLRERYVGEVKPLRDTEQEIAKLQQFLHGPATVRKASLQRNPAYDDMNVALTRAQADASSIDQQIALRSRQEANLEDRLRKLEEGAKSLDDAQRERRTLEELVHTYRQQYEAARMTEDLDRSNVVSVSVLQKPIASAKPAGPRHLPFALAGILIGLVGASGMLIYLLVFRETLITVESVERIIGVPVLASVPNSRRSDNDNRAAA